MIEKLISNISYTARGMVNDNCRYLLVCAHVAIFYQCVQSFSVQLGQKYKKKKKKAYILDCQNQKFVVWLITSLSFGEYKVV